MAIMDALLLLSDAQAVTADAVSTNTVDLGSSSVARQIGSGEPIGVMFTVDVAADITTGDETYTLTIVSSASADLSSPTVIASITLTAAQLAAAARWFLPLPPRLPGQRYIGARYDVGGTTPTVTITAAVQPASMANTEGATVFYAKGYTV